MRSVLIGVDGLAFRIIQPLIERGELPNFRRLQQEGCEGVLESKYPPLTPPAWISLSTGMKPARHGVYDFWAYDEQQEPGVAREPRVQTKRKGEKAIWNILSDYGKQVVVMNVPMTYPPEAVNGIMISGYMTPSSDTEFTYPNAFKDELKRVVPEYEIELDFNKIYVGKADEHEQRLIDATLHMTEQRIKLLTYLLDEKPWDFFYIGFVGPDRLQHPLWKQITSFDSDAIEYFRRLDAALGLILDKLGSDDTLFVVSDHGFQGATTVFDINEYLRSKGLLVLKEGFQQQKAKVGRLARFKKTLNRIGLLTLARNAKKALARTGIVKQNISQKDKPLLDDKDIDWEQTLAHVPSHSGYSGGYTDIFLSDKLSNEQITELCENLKQQMHPETGKLLVDALYTEEVYGKGPFAPRERHLLVLPTDGITFRMHLGSKQFWNELPKVHGTHQKDGVLYAYGQGIKRGFRASNAEIYDVVPTILRSMNLPPPCTFDGHILDELFVETKQAGQTTTETDAKGGKTRRKLSKLLEV